MAPINVTTSKQQITASVAEDKVTATVSSGFGATGPSGVVNVTAPITNSGTTTSANVGLSVGSGLSVSGGSLVVTPGAYAPLVNNLVPSANLPSYVDDVLEYAGIQNLPAVGETGKIYVTLDNNKTYRWSGSTYIEISSGPSSTDAVQEGVVNLYFTNQRVADALPVATASVLGGVKIGSGISIDGNGVISSSGGYTLPIATAGALGGVRIGSGITIDPATGVISASSGYTLPVATNSVLGGVKIGSGVTITDGVISVSTNYAAASHTHDFTEVTDDNTYTNFLTETGGTLHAALQGIDSAISGRVRYRGVWDETINDAGGYVSGDVVKSGAALYALDAAASASGQGPGDAIWPQLTFDGAYTSLTSVPSTFAPSAHKTSHATGGSDALSPSDIGAATALHAHGAITSDGKVGSTAGLVLKTGTAGAVEALAQGTAGQVLKVNSGATGVEWGAAAADVSIDASAADVLSASSGSITADDAGADKLVFWDDSAGKLTYLAVSTGLSISGTTFTASVSASDISQGTLAYARISDPTVTSPSQITGSQNDYASFARGINRFTTNGAYNLTGMAAGNDGEVRVLCNTGTTAANTLTIKDESTSSTAANRFSVPWNGDCVIPAEGSVVVFYDGTSSRWRVV